MGFDLSLSSANTLKTNIMLTVVSFSNAHVWHVIVQVFILIAAHG